MFINLQFSKIAGFLTLEKRLFSFTLICLKLTARGAPAL